MLAACTTNYIFFLCLIITRFATLHISCFMCDKLNIVEICGVIVAWRYTINLYILVFWVATQRGLDGSSETLVTTFKITRCLSLGDHDRHFT